jgi:hypothetical protein
MNAISIGLTRFILGLMADHGIGSSAVGESGKVAQDAGR